MAVQLSYTGAEADALLDIVNALTATSTELNYTDGVTSNIQTQLNAKATAASYTGAATIVTVGTIGTGTWQGTAIANAYVAALPTSKITSGTFADARIAASNVTQHEAALTITESQISDLGSYITGYTVTEGNVTAHEAALTITESQISDLGSYVTNATAKPTEAFTIAVSDETTALTTGTAKVTFRMPYAFTLTDVRASVTTAPTGSVLTADINEGGVSILSTKLTIDATEKTSETAATAAVISDSALADDAEITVDIDGVGSTVAGAGLKITLIGNRT